jgi:hypothetical protein
VAAFEAPDDRHWAGRSFTIRFLEPERKLVLADERLYKVRWDVNREAK